jgi:hypothetical protein
MDKWYFDLLGPRQDIWVWRRMSESGTLIAMSSRQFSYYLDCVADAEKHGYTGPPSFRSSKAGRQRA